MSAKYISDNQVALFNQTEKTHSVQNFEAHANNLIESDPQLNSLAKKGKSQWL